MLLSWEFIKWLRAQRFRVRKLVKEVEDSPFLGEHTLSEKAGVQVGEPDSLFGKCILS